MIPHVLSKIKHPSATFYPFFKQFELCAGLKMNVDKTKAKVLGPETMPHDNLFGLDWTEEAIHTLSVSLSGDENDHYILNYKKRLKNMKNLLSSWECRRLSLKGKVTVINTLAVSPLLYLASVIHVPAQVIQEVKTRAVSDCLIRPLPASVNALLINCAWAKNMKVTGIPF